MYFARLLARYSVHLTKLQYLLSQICEFHVVVVFSSLRLSSLFQRARVCVSPKPDSLTSFCVVRAPVTRVRLTDRERGLNAVISKAIRNNFYIILKLRFRHPHSWLQCRAAWKKSCIGSRKHNRTAPPIAPTSQLLTHKIINYDLFFLVS